MKERPGILGDLSVLPVLKEGEEWGQGPWTRPSGLSSRGQGGLNGATCIRNVAITSLLAVIQLPSYHHFKQPSDLERQFTTDVQVLGNSSTFFLSWRS
jgi:hypothetical protein